MAEPEINTFLIDRLRNTSNSLYDICQNCFELANVYYINAIIIDYAIINTSSSLTSIAPNNSNTKIYLKIRDYLFNRSRNLYKYPYTMGYDMSGILHNILRGGSNIETGSLRIETLSASPNVTGISGSIEPYTFTNIFSVNDSDLNKGIILRLREIKYTIQHKLDTLKKIS